MRCRGFTFVEVLIVAALFTLFGIVALIMGQAGGQAWMTTDSRLETMTTVQIALNRLSEDLRKASQATLSAAACSEATGLSFKPLNPDGSLGPAILYVLDGGALTRTQTGGAPQVVAGGVTQFRPTCQADGIVKLQLTTQASRGAGHGGVFRALESSVWVQNP